MNKDVKRLILICAGLMVATLLGGWFTSISSRSSLRQEIMGLQEQRAYIESEIDALNNVVVERKDEMGTAKYVLTLELRQSHFSFDVTEHFKDALNTMEIQIPVDKEYYEAVEIGQDIVNEFRMGSFVFKGSAGNFKVTVKDKEIQ